MTIEEQIATKVAEIEKWEGILDRYGRGRWYWKYRLRINDLETDLKELRSRNIDGDVSPS